MVGGLFCEVAYFDFLIAVGYGRGAVGARFDAGEVSFFGDIVVNVPAALKGVSNESP